MIQFMNITIIVIIRINKPIKFLKFKLSKNLNKKNDK
jgi:hypothetical protein